MVNRIINLKKDFGKEGNTVSRESIFAPVEEPLVAEHLSPTPPDITATVRFSWSGYEYEKYERRPAWFLLPFALATALVIFGIVVKSYFFVGFVAVAFVTLMLYSRREPAMVSCVVTEDGIRAGTKEYLFADCKSFWIFETPFVRELSLEMRSMVMPYIRLPLGDSEAEALRGVLSRSLTEREHKEFLADHIARILGF